MKFTEKMSERLNTLLEKTYDSEKGYLQAMNKVDNTEIKMFFKQTADRRSDFARDLRREILSYGEIPEESGTLKGDTQRFWTNIKTLLSGNKEEAVLKECLKYEKESMEEYDNFLKDQATLPPTTIALLTQHRNAIQKAINRAMVYEESVS
ncbi:ferritin-like domain-containing protein [Robertkochia solimangrovi]|uniref:ferritin-like domain-containing protein n=1 Tax=Robertkochia solimangrovi TaxID=2213046 RepID=UPI00117C48D8|nr:PA2169 family four-helix-bundle protein [Robertkochia solimangrovi]TRZ46313.1 hypothetical protein DMZ48_03395 [Robertkochia solimangrovi]